MVFIFTYVCVGDMASTTSHVSSSPPSHEFYTQNPLNVPQQTTHDSLSVDMALVGGMSSKFSESERIELQATNPSQVEDSSFIQEVTDIGASSEILLPRSTIPMKTKDTVVPGID